MNRTEKIERLRDAGTDLMVRAHGIAALAKDLRAETDAEVLAWQDVQRILGAVYRINKAAAVVESVGAKALKRAAKLEAKRGLPERNRITPETAKRIVAMREEGLSYRAIAKRLTDEGVPTALPRRSAGVWAAETVRQVHLAAL